MMKKVMLLILALASLGLVTAKEPTVDKGYQPTLTVVLNSPLLTTVTIEQTFYELSSIEFAYGFKLRTNYTTEHAAAPFVSIVNYGNKSSWWLEFTIPSGFMRHIGLSESWFTFGYQYRW